MITNNYVRPRNTTRCDIFTCAKQLTEGPA